LRYTKTLIYVFIYLDKSVSPNRAGSIPALVKDLKNLLRNHFVQEFISQFITCSDSEATLKNTVLGACLAAGLNRGVRTKLAIARVYRTSLSCPNIATGMCRC
jgi:hypothetical protein